MATAFRKFLCLTAAFLVLSAALHAQVDTAALTAQLQKNKDQLGKNYVFALFKDGKTIYKREAGEFNLKTPESINASSQWLTAALAMVLVQEGKVGLDDKVSTYLPIFSKYGKGYITLRHCLTYNTGIDGSKAFEKGKFKNLEEEVEHIAINREIKTNPGTEFYYSNVGFKIAARVLEVVAKKPFERLIKEKLTSPLAMRNTSFANENYDRAPDPASGAKSTAFDYLNFLSMLLNKGMFNGKQVLTEESVKALLSLQAKVTEVKNVPKDALKADLAMGSWIMEKNDKDEPVAYTAPGFNGIYPVLDICRGYAFIIFTKDGAEVKKELSQQIKSLIDESLSCQ
jgi:CubicO group peptidase (beta-lactamase class C family)